MPDEDDDAPAAIPFREPGDLAKRIANGHAQSAHFEDVSAADLAGLIQLVMSTGRVKRRSDRILYWHVGEGLAVLVSPRDRDGGTAFPSDEMYFEA